MRRPSPFFFPLQSVPQSSLRLPLPSLDCVELRLKPEVKALSLSFGFFVTAAKDHTVTSSAAAAAVIVSVVVVVVFVAAAIHQHWGLALVSFQFWRQIITTTNPTTSSLPL